MTAYVAFLIDIHDQAAFTRYARAAAPTYPIYGGGVALRGPIVDVLEGDLRVSRDTRLVVLQFPALGQAHAWWDSEDYRSEERRVGKECRSRWSPEHYEKNKRD